jgi:hypothetical protein
MKSFHASPGLRNALLFAMVGLLFWCAGARAQSQAPLVNEVHTLATASQAVPIEQSFSVTDAGTYQVQLTDVGAAQSTPAPLKYVALAITNGSTIVGTPLTAAGTTQFTASAAGTYVVRIVGQPDTTKLGSGPVLVTITNTATNAVLTAFEQVLAQPTSATSNFATVNDTFTVTTSGTYTVTLTDWRFPQALAVVELALASPSQLLASMSITAGTAVGTPASVTLQPNTTYTLFAAGQVGSAATAGLYTAVVRDPSGNAVYSRTVPIGALQPLGNIALTGGSRYALSFTDLSVPAALSASGPNGTIATLDEIDAQPLTGGPTRNFTAAASTMSNGQPSSYQVFGLGTAATSPGGGSYAVSITPAGTGTPAPVFSVAQAVTTSGGALQAFSYNTSVTSAGTYTVQLADFQHPQALTSLNLVAVQNGAGLATPLTAAGSSTITAAAGNLSLLVFAQPPSGSGSVGGVFGYFVTPAAGGTLILEGTQGVGSTSSVVFASRKAAVTAAGSYVAQVADVGFPTTFANFDVLVTQGTTVTGTFVNGGSLPITAAGAADYFVTFTAQPQVNSQVAADEYQAGTYAITFGAGPAVTLSSNVAQVASGGNITLTWSSQNATSCTASGGWTGSEQLSGSASEGPLTANTTYTLTCTGLGQTASQSVTVTVGSSGGGGGGGHHGGSFDLTSLAALGGLLLLRARAGWRRGGAAASPSRLPQARL